MHIGEQVETNSQDERDSDSESDEAEERREQTELLAHIDEEENTTLGYVKKGLATNPSGPEKVLMRVVELSPLGRPIGTGERWTCPMGRAQHGHY